MLQAPGREPGDAVVWLATIVFSRSFPCRASVTLFGQRIVRGDILNRRDDGFALGAVVPGLVPQCQTRVDVVLHARGVAVLTALVVVVVDTAVVVARSTGAGASTVVGVNGSSQAAPGIP